MADRDPAPHLRVDAARNRERLLEIAGRAFAAGIDPVSLEAIAREAEVGIGTLYRHFPTREALVEAVYRSELADVCASAAPLLERLAPPEALRAWMDRYADFVRAKRGMAGLLGAMLSSGAIKQNETRARIDEALQSILDAGAETGSLRGDVPADDVATALVGIFMATAKADSREQADRLLDLLAESLRI